MPGQCSQPHSPACYRHIRWRVRHALRGHKPLLPGFKAGTFLPACLGEAGSSDTMIFCQKRSPTKDLRPGVYSPSHTGPLRRAACPLGTLCLSISPALALVPFLCGQSWTRATPRGSLQVISLWALVCRPPLTLLARQGPCSTQGGLHRFGQSLLSRPPSKSSGPRGSSRRD